MLFGSIPVLKKTLNIKRETKKKKFLTSTIKIRIRYNFLHFAAFFFFPITTLSGNKQVTLHAVMPIRFADVTKIREGNLQKAELSALEFN